MISPRRWASREAELLDDPRADAGVVVASLGDIARINRLFGGARAAVSRLDEFVREARPGATLTLLDVGTGLGDVPREAARRAARRGVTLKLIGLERHPAAARAAGEAGDLGMILADGATIPLRSHSVDLVLCAKLLHHLPGQAGTRLLCELDRVARAAVVVADINRSALAALGIWLVSFPLGFHPATRHDAVVSVFRGFTRSELERVCRAAGVRAGVRVHSGWCLTAAWRPSLSAA